MGAAPGHRSDPVRARRAEVAVPPRELRGDGGGAAFGGGDDEEAVHGAEALRQAGQAGTGAGVGATAAVVAYLDHQPVVGPPDIDGGGTRPAVLADVLE